MILIIRWENLKVLIFNFSGNYWDLKFVYMCLKEYEVMIIY